MTILNLRVWTLCFALLFAALPYGAIGQVSKQETSEQHIQRLVKEAAGMQPIRNFDSSSQGDFDTAFRLQYRSLIQSNQEYEIARKQLDPHMMSQLGTPQSLALPASAEAGLTQLRLAYKLEVEHERKVERIYANLKHIFETADWAAPRRKAFLNLFESTMVKPAQERQRCIAAEKVWIDSLGDLYQYAITHNKNLRLDGGVITIDDPIIQAEFNSKIVSEESRRALLLQVKQEYARMQAQVFRSLAVDPKTVGLQ